MEFNYRAADDPPPLYMSTPPPAGVTYYSDSPFRGGYSYNADRMQSPPYMRDQFNLREMEKQRIREEIIAEDFMRRRVLEAEVRMEMMMEREMAMRKAVDLRVPYGERFPMQLEHRAPYVPQYRNRWVEEEPPPPHSGRWERRSYRGELLELPEPRPRPRPPSPDVRAPPPERKNEKLIMLSRPDSDHSGKKRKSPPESGVLSLPSTSWKKPKEEWSCAVCRVSATSEKGLNEHVKGKKHQAKEEELRVQKMVKDAYNRPWPKKTGEPSRVSNPSATAIADAGRNKVAPSELNKTGTDSDQKMKFKNKDHKLLPQKTNHGAPNFVKNKKKFRFWCDDCSVGAYSNTVFDDHLKGKGHRARLEELELEANGGRPPQPLQILHH